MYGHPKAVGEWARGWVTQIRREKTRRILIISVAAVIGVAVIGYVALRIAGLDCP